MSRTTAHATRLDGDALDYVAALVYGGIDFTIRNSVSYLIVDTDRVRAKFTPRGTIVARAPVRMIAPDRRKKESQGE